MEQKVIINNFQDVKQVVACAAKLPEDVDIRDCNGSVADAKSILGMMSLNYNNPVSIIAENEFAVKMVATALERSKVLRQEK